MSSEEIVSLRAKFEDPISVGGYGYKHAKDELLATIMKWREGKKEMFDDLMSHPEKIVVILEEGGTQAQSKARETITEVRAQIGL